MNTQENEDPSYQLNRLPKVDPIKELELLQFLEKPIDSRDIIKTPLFGTKSKVPANATNIQITRPLPKVVTMQGESQEELQKDWEKRFARINVNTNNCHHHCCGRSHSSPQYASLAQRQLHAKKDNLHILDIETISNLRHRQVQGPSVQLSHLPQLRCLPTDLSNRKLRRR
ncbi:hypothetical protein M9Y10_013717 [Tritrichomonas musculus]|uniref:Uncharacterized protein n=1 Tax=Tritrichomonas musculus TaxID=1915356 RepID=A0ABR2KZI9_9EUKA